MPGSLNEIKKKIQATKNTRKITKAMQLVAASKMRVFQKKAVSSRTYAWDLLSILKATLHVGRPTPERNLGIYIVEETGINSVSPWMMPRRIA